MKADKPLEWNLSEWPKDPNFYEAWGIIGKYSVRKGHFDDPRWYVYGTDSLTECRSYGTKEAAMQVAQDHHNRRLRLKAWEDYMLAHNPPEGESDTASDTTTEANLSFLRQDAADALRVYLNLRTGSFGRDANLAALGYINAHTKYTLACLEAKRGDILPYVELPKEH